MNLPQIRMESQNAKIGIEQSKASLSIKQPKADLSITQPKAEVHMRSERGKLTIDQSQAWAEVNLMSTLRLTEKNAKEGIEGAQEGTARRAEQGSSLMRIEEDRQPIVEQAIENGGRPLKTIGLKYMPSPFSVKIDYEPGYLEVNVTPKAPVIDAMPRKPEIEYNPSKINIYMERYASLKIDFENLFSASI